MKYILSTGEITPKVERYVLDLVKVYLSIMPGDIPGNPDLGFDFNLVGIKKADLPGEVKARLKKLVSQIQSQFSTVTVTLETVEVYDEETVRFTITVAGTESEDYEIKI